MTRFLGWRGLSMLLLGGAALVPFACSDSHINTASGGGGNASASGGAGPGQTGSSSTGLAGTGTGQGGTGGVAPPTSIAQCQGHTYQCGDLIDNDNDGLVDSQDPDCLGPCDNTEDSLFGGIPGQSGPPCKVDCYFDQDSGPGNDDCYWTHECDAHEVAPDYYPEADHGASCTYAGPNHVVPPTGKTCAELDATQSAACLSYCGPLTPNGCDCFGCCNLPAGTNNYVWLGSTGKTGTTVCTLDKVNDPTVCEPCQPVAACLNPCDPCEICIGKPLPSPGCGSSTSTGTGGGQQCPSGQTACGLPGQPACASGYFCNTGCCQQVPQ